MTCKSYSDLIAFSYIHQVTSSDVWIGSNQQVYASLIRLFSSNKVWQCYP